jgi:hypothetical protein
VGSEQEDVTVLPAMFNPVADRRARSLREIIIYPMFRNHHFCLMIYSRSEQVLLLLGIILSLKIKTLMSTVMDNTCSINGTTPTGLIYHELIVCLLKETIYVIPKIQIMYVYRTS